MLLLSVKNGEIYDFFTILHVVLLDIYCVACKMYFNSKLRSGVINLELSKDTLTSFYTLDGGEEKIASSGFLNQNHCQLALIYTAGLDETIKEYGSAFAMAVLENIAMQIPQFFSCHNIDTICCRVVKHTFAVFFSGVDNQECRQLMQLLFEKLQKIYFGRSEDSHPQIRIGIYHFTDTDRNYRKSLAHAGAAIDSIAPGKSGITFYQEGLEERIAYIPSQDHTLRMPAEKLTDYDSAFIAFAVRMLSGSRDLDSSTDLLLERIGNHFGFDHVLIEEFIEGHSSRIVSKWTRKDGVFPKQDKIISFERFDGFFVDFDKRGFNVVPDVRKASFTEKDKAFFKAENIRAFINIMMFDHDNPIGYISFGKSEPLDTDTEQLMSTLAHLSRILASFLALRIQQNKQMDRIHALSIDNLTGLYTYAAFQRKVHHRLRHYKPDRTYAFISADISHFSNLNENFGYTEGDHVLRLFSKKLKAGNQDHIISCHLDADRFLLFMESESREAMQEQIHGLSNEFESYLNKRYPISDLRVVTGVYYVSNPNKELLYMIDSANHARKSIKEDYARSVAIYSDELRTQRKRLLDVVGSIHDAIEDGFIEAFLQPKFSMQQRNIVGAEALVRWRNPDNSYRYPDQFIPILENAGLIVDLDMCIFRQVLSALSRWKEDGKPLIPISVNFSRVHFRDDSFYRKVVALTERYDVDPRLIEVEVTESTFGENRENLYLQLERLRDYGFSVDIDDFGTGYSTLNMLMSAPVDIVKVDKSFIDHYETPKEQTYINQIGSLILSADKQIIFEGVETEDQIKVLTNYGYEYAQGYFFSRPIPLPDFERKYIYTPADTAV